MKNKNRFFFILSLLTGLVSFSLIFVSGRFSNKTYVEKVSDYASEVAVEHTKSGNLATFTVKKTAESGPLPQADVEFYNLYGIFKQEKITFASTINANKEDHIIKFADIDSDNLSMMYMGPFGTIKYNNHYKHYVWPIEMMFSDSKKGYDVSNYLVNISQSHADKLLEKNDIKRQQDGSFLYDDYKKLQYQPIDLIIDGKPAEKFVINNIYFESNYYYDGLYETMGEFVMVSYYLPFNLRNDQTSMYFMSKYSYQNDYFMDYINTTFANKKYDLKLNHYNLKEDVDEKLLLSFYYGYDLYSNKYASSLLFSFSIILLCFSLFLFLKYSLKYNFIFVILSSMLFIVPYLAFFMMNLIFKNVLWFSSISCSIYCWSLIAYVFAYLIYYFVRKYPHTRKEINEINI